MKKFIPILAILMAISVFAFSSTISLKDIYLNWFEPSDLNTWTTSWMLPVLYKEATNTTVINGYYRNESGPDALNIFGVYAFDKFIGGDYMRASVNASYTTFTFKRYTIGLAVPDTGFDIRYINAMDGNLQYYNEIGLDIEYILFDSTEGKSRFKGFSYVKVFNLVRYMKLSYPENSSWKPIFSMNYLFRTVWMLPQFALIYDDYSGIDEISSQPESYNSLELLIKVMSNVILKGG